MRFRGLVPFIVFPSVIYTLSYFGIPLSLLSIIVVISGIMCAGLAEYGLHRVAFHNRRIPRKIKRLISHGHVYHHRYPDRTENLVLPLALTLPASLLLLGLFVLLFGTGYAFWFYFGIVSSYFLYEFLHYSTHHLPLSIPYFKQMQKYHLKHHNDSPNTRFMITNPLLDWVFRTSK